MPRASAAISLEEELLPLCEWFCVLGASSLPSCHRPNQAGKQLTAVGTPEYNCRSAQAPMDLEAGS